MGDIDPALPVPIYYQLLHLLLAQIDSGVYPPGAKLPTEHEICERYGISRTPVTRALSDLAAEGVVLRRRRLGTIVNPDYRPSPSGRDTLTLLAPRFGWAAGLDAFGELTQAPASEVRARLNRGVVEGSAPDVAVVAAAHVADLAASGTVYALEELDATWVPQELEVDFPLASLCGGYGVPVAQHLAGLWVRREALAGTGPEGADAWGGLLDAARSARDGDPVVTSAIVLPGLGEETAVVEVVSALIGAHGGTIIQDGGVALRGAATVAALESIRSLVDEGLMSPDAAGLTSEDGARLLGSGGSIATFGRSIDLPLGADGNPMGDEERGDSFSFLPVPPARGGLPAAAVGGWAAVIPRQARRPDLVVRVLAAMMEAGLLRMTAGWLPARTPGAGPFPDRSLATAAGAASPVPPLVGYGVAAAEIRDMLQSVVTGRMRPAPAAARAGNVLSAVTGLPELT
ncbi:MAG: extracellular solute-binding protein [Acidimicrobiia bacterium]